ncbi:MAG TPA: phosphatase PAP2 family protein [Gemmatimonadaceae bacterium]|nr:phosphatase PAP2 family protein [Gemmatimonadaceae bacterium]
MSHPDQTIPPPLPGTPPRDDRRSRPRGYVHFFWDLLFAALRLIGRHARGFYATVGIFLVLGGVIALLGAWAFAAVAGAVREGATQRFDDYVMRAVAARQIPALERAALEITFLGTGLVVVTIVAIAGLFLYLSRHRYSAALLLFATVGALLLNNLLKASFDRPRPQVFQWGTHVLSSSFPSGHAMSATVVYSMVAFLAARLEAKRWIRWLVILVAMMLIALIGASRVYLGVHFPSDILAGVLIGFAWAGFCLAMFEAVTLLGRRAAPVEMAKQELPPPAHDPPPPEEVKLTERDVDEAVEGAKREKDG